jgi:hypothetical protein
MIPAGGRLSTPFLLGFSAAVVDALVQKEALVLHDRDDAVQQLAAALAEARPNESLVGLVERALIASPAVDELFADTDDVKSAIEALKFAEHGP